MPDTTLPRCMSLEPLRACGTQGAQAQIKVANILLVIDKSGSMNDTPMGFPSSKWLGLKSALAQALPPVADDVNFGLLLYPFSTVRPIMANCMDAECCQVPDGAEAVRVPVAVGTTSIAQITSALDGTAPGGGTPTAAALARAYEYFTTGAGASLAGEKYVMLATDGGPNCNTMPRSCDACHCTTNLDKGGTTCATESSVCDEAQLPYLCLDDQSVLAEVTKLKNANIPTFVIGIPGTEAYAAFLDPIADAGGKAVMGAAHRFYQVSAQGGVQGLVDVFREITTQLVRSCEIQLSKNPPDITNVNVALDCELIPQNPNDAGSNWHIDTSTNPNKLIFEGQTCTYIQTKGANRVDVVYGCPPVN